jgi:cell division protein FtsI/penicillin-binding protein 2
MAAHTKVIVAAALLMAAALMPATPAAGANDADRLTAAMHLAFVGHDGAAVVLRVRDGKLLAVYNPRILAHRLATPGSSIKPFTLELLLRKGLLKRSERFACRRGLTVAGVRLNCSHPEGLRPFDAVEALAFSCNSYFTEAAKRLPAGELEASLRAAGFEEPTGLMGGEANGQVVSAKSMESRELLAIGAAGVEITPLELAMAYRRLAGWQTAPSAAQRVVLEGLGASADYGLARAAQPEKLKIAGKTGTASNPGSAVTHAWFAGFAPREAPQIVVVVYLERGRGSVDAAAIARRIFEAWGSR